VYQQPWFSTRDFPDNLPGIWSKYWAYLQQDGIAPVFIGEFGGRSVGQDAEGIWQQRLLQFLRTNAMSYTYWSWNPDSGDTGGILADDWSTLDQRKLAMLSGYNAVSGESPPPEAARGPAPPPAAASAVDTGRPPAAAATVAGPEPATYRVPVPPPGARLAPGGPFDPDFAHVRAGIGGPGDPDAAHRQARAEDEQLYLRMFGTPWPYAAYATGDGGAR
jgi:endoglucanase